MSGFLTVTLIVLGPASLALAGANHHESDASPSGLVARIALGVNRLLAGALVASHALCLLGAAAVAHTA